MSTLNIPMTKTDPLQKRIGIISLFPKQSGLFFDHRIRLIEHPIQVVDHSIISAIKKFAFGQRYFSHKTSCFPESIRLFHTDVNVLIAKNIIEKLSLCPDTTLIPLPPLETEQSVTGYMIEGSWGVETNSVTVKGLLPFFQHHHLDQIIAIVPITHFVPILESEGHGIEVYFEKNRIFFSCCYALLIFDRIDITGSDPSYQKTFGSIKQVYTYSEPFESESIHKIIKTRKYDARCAEAFYTILQKYLIPHLLSQYQSILNYPDPKTFLRPKKPFGYWAK